MTDPHTPGPSPEAPAGHTHGPGRSHDPGQGGSPGHSPGLGHPHDGGHSQGQGRSLGHGHSHGHGHGHGLEGSWETWLAVPALRVILGLVAFFGVATVIGIVALWPDGSGRDAAMEEASQLGLVTERYDATVLDRSLGPCSYSTPEEPQECLSYTYEIDEGPDAGVVIALPEINLTIGAPAPELAVGDAVVLGYEPTTDFYFYADRDRGATLVWLAVLFAIVVIALGRARGALALLAMAITVAVLVGFVAPSVLDGNDPVLVAVVGGAAIAFVSLYLTHGFNPTTTVALAGTLGALALTLAIAGLFFRLANFTGFASEEGLTLPLVADINLSSLLLGGAVLGALGALDDVTVTQVATVAELRHRNQSLTTAELVGSGIRVGREHIASTVNTLLLAYAGASMPLLLLFAVSNQSLTTVANSELVAVEIVRTLCGSIGLVAAVPITTLMAAVLVGSDAPTTPPTNGAVAAGDVRPTDPPPAAASMTTPPVGAPSVDAGFESPADEEPPFSPPRQAASWDDFAPDDVDGL
ncbi:MAG: YibE/F family protein [Actinomycetota bacterium]